MSGLVRFETKLELRMAMLCNSGGRPPWLATEVHRVPHLIVVDEVHRHRRVLEALSEIFLQSEEESRIVAEAALTKPFRAPARGRRTWPKWLLLSATPFNPVSLDTSEPAPPSAFPVDALAIGQAHQFYCHLTGQSLRLGFDRERMWYELLRLG